VQAAAQQNIELLIASEGKYSLVPECARGLQIDFTNPAACLESIRNEATQRRFDAVIAPDDATAELASRAAQQLGLTGNTPESVVFTRRKDMARACQRAAGLPVPDFRLIDVGRLEHYDAGEFGYPAVLKPLAMSASRGVMRVNTPAEWRRACMRLAAIIRHQPDAYERSHVLMEGYIPGDEVAVEGILRDGRLRLLAMFDKPEPLTGPCFEESYYITPSRLPAELQQRIAASLAEVCNAYGLKTGPVHGEFRINADGVWPLEVAARTIGGDCARLLRSATGLGLEELVLANAVGRELAFEDDLQAAGVLMIPIPCAGILRRVEGVLAASRVPLVEDVVISIREGYELVPLPEGGGYLGFIFARGPDPAQVEQALRRAHACLNIVTAPLMNIAPHA
jgi:biotin carboxylase